MKQKTLLALLCLLAGACASTPKPVASEVPKEPECSDAPTLGGGVKRDCADRAVDYMKLADIGMSQQLFQSLLTGAKAGHKWVDQDEVPFTLNGKRVQVTRQRYRDVDGGALKGELLAVYLAQPQGAEILSCTSKGMTTKGLSQCQAEWESMQKRYPSFKHEPVETMLLIAKLMGQNVSLPDGCMGQDPTSDKKYGAVVCGKNVLNWFARDLDLKTQDFLDHSDRLETEFKKEGAEVQRVTQACHSVEGKDFPCRRWLLTMPDQTHLDAVTAIVPLEDHIYLLTVSGIVPAADGSLSDGFIWGVLGLWRPAHG